MKHFLFAIFLLALLRGQTASAEIPAGWQTNENDFISATNAEPPMTLLYFTASWCGPCKMMAHTTLALPQVTNALASLSHFAFDIDEYPRLASEYSVEAVPTMIFLSSGHEVDRLTGYQPAEGFLKWLTNGVAEAAAAREHLAKSQATLAEVDQLLAAPGTNSLPLAAAKLFDLCSDPDIGLAKDAAHRLKRIAESDPAIVLVAMNDPRLAVRIQAANVLRGVLGDKFNADPWADSAVRQQAVDACRAQLARSAVH